MKEIRWLHLTDLHAGMSAQEWLWPRFQMELLDDLARLHDRSGPWNTLIFSGDLVRTGAAEEFALFSDLLGKIIHRCSELGSNLKVITVPGNHDLLRPKTINPNFVSLKSLEDSEELLADFWSVDEAGNRLFVNSRFENYRVWRDKSISDGIHQPMIQEGLLVGDAAYVIENGGASIRICGINSTWMQLGAGNYDGKLIVDIKQLLALTGNEPDSWLAEADFAALVTHQPSNWLTPKSQETWRSDVYTPDRFDIHMFGHMHRPASVSQSDGGSTHRRSLQGPSLFGYEQTEAGWERIQGYGAYRLSDAEGARELEGWPRKLVSLQSGVKKLRPDNSFDIDETTSSFRETFQRVKPSGPSKAKVSSIDDALEQDNSTINFELRTLETTIVSTPGHEAVRLAEQAIASAAWRESKRAFWLKSDWGYGSTHFIASVRLKASLENARVFRFDASKFSSKATFLDDVRLTFGLTFEEICNKIEKVGSCILVLDDIFSETGINQVAAVTEELESLLTATKDYLPHGVFVLNARAFPSNPSSPVVELKPLDEPDTRAYVTAEKPLDNSITTGPAIERLHRLTDGHPSRIDSALRQLRVVGLSELAMTNPDVSGHNSQVAAPSGLPQALADLKAVGPTGERAFDLLCVLAAFPHGEQFERLKRFNDKKPFFPPNATLLLDRSLIDSVSFRPMGQTSDVEDARLLIVPRPVREYVRSRMNVTDKLEVDQKAIDLYFGSKWKTGIESNTIAHKIAENPLAAPHELANANTLLNRLVSGAIENGLEYEIASSIRVAANFTNKLHIGSHYRSALSLCNDIIPQIPASEDEQKVFLQIQRARALRMTGKPQEARDQYLSIDLDNLPRNTRQDAYLGICLTQFSLSDTDSATHYARLAEDINPKSITAHHARIQMAQMKPFSPERTAELIELRNKAASRKWYHLVNNVNLFLSSRQEGAERTRTLRAVIDSSPKSKDYYNKFRAIINLFENRETGDPVLYSDKMSLYQAYHFFHNERTKSQFNKVHSILWKLFEEESDLRNLLSLFRHSSFIWRLSDDAESEREYISKLKDKGDQIRKSNLINIQRDRTYFLTRVDIVVLGGA